MPHDEQPTPLPRKNINRDIQIAAARAKRQFRADCSHDWHFQGIYNSYPFWVCQSCGAEKIDQWGDAQGEGRDG